jgi:hypothetical protein
MQTPQRTSPLEALDAHDSSDDVKTANEDVDADTSSSLAWIKWTDHRKQEKDKQAAAARSPARAAAVITLRDAR